MPSTLSPAESVSSSILPLLLQTGGALAMIVAMLWLLRWIIQRYSTVKHRQYLRRLKVTETLTLGPRERLLIISTGESELLIGVTPQCISYLSTLSPHSPVDSSSSQPTDNGFRQTLSACWLKKETCDEN